MHFRDKRPRTIQLDITPIVDMVFNLLIFFALSINFSAPGAINLSLPTTSLPSPSPQAPVIQITRALAVTLDGDPVSLEQIPAALDALKVRTAGPGIIIMADKDVPHGLVVNVMDMCRQAGFEKLSIAARVH